MIQNRLPQTLGELKESGYVDRPVKQEMRENLIKILSAKEPLFSEIIGYDETVLKQLKTAMLGRHDLILLGQRGQGKTRLLRQLVYLLDEYLPAISGTEINDNPFHPVSHLGKQIVSELGDDTPVKWLKREDRYSEKLATPDVTVADIIGDIDPVKAMNEKLTYGDEGIIHFGIVPRSNRGIFVINELPDLQARIQVALLNIMEERDFQIRGFRIRMPLDIMIAFSANPEDYTNRGNIITPLKDRIDSQIITHYPKTLSDSMQITDQEAWLERDPSIQVPGLVREIVESIAFEARDDKDYIDPASGVSVRLSISALENLVSGVELRSLETQNGAISARINDLENVIPALTGKLELVYEGEQEGPLKIAREMISRATKTIFHQYFRDPYNRKESNPEDNPYFPVIQWFENGSVLEINNNDDDMTYLNCLKEVPAIEKVMEQCILDKKHLPKNNAGKICFLELLLEGLYLNSRIAKENVTHGFVYRDMMSGIMGS